MYITNIQSAIDYIEENLQENLKLADIANVSGYSMFHFDRIFKYTVGESIIEYVRKRKLTESSRELISSKNKIIDIAFKYGFNSQQSYSLAFKKLYNKSPGEYRKNQKDLALLGKKRLTMESVGHLSHGITREPKLVKLDPFNVVGLLYFGSNSNGEIPNLWSEFVSRKDEIKFKLDSHNHLGICDFVPDYDPVTSEFYYLAGVKVDKVCDIPKGMVAKSYPKSKYAVFTHKGSSESLEDTYGYIYGTYFPKSNLQLAEEADFELYDERFNDDNDSEMDIYIPIK